MKRINNQWAVIKKQGTVIAKLGNKPYIPDNVADYEEFVIVSVPGASGMTDKEIDRSGLTDSEEELINQVQPLY